MTILPYIQATHEARLKQILLLRDLSPSLTSDLPAFGLVAIKSESIVGCGFIRSIEGSYAMLDSYLTNPIFSKENRHTAIDKITAKLLKICKETSPSVKLFCFTEPQILQEIAERHGFHPTKHITLVK